MNAKDIDLVEKWLLTTSLMGIEDAVKLWDSHDNAMYDALSYLEDLEEKAQLLEDRDRGYLTAVKAQQMGITISMLQDFNEYREEQARLAHQKMLIEEEVNNELLNTLRNDHKFKINVGPRIKQIYWSFNGDIGDGGVFDYNCRIVRLSYGGFRVWLERTDGKKTYKERREHTRHIFGMDTRWPMLWRQNSPTPSWTQLAYTYTQAILDEERMRKDNKRKLKEKAAARKLAKQQAAATVAV